MLLEIKPFEEKLSLAINSKDTNILVMLLCEPSSKIRRALARNLNTPKSALNILAYDPVLNVAFKALENPNCTVKRVLSDTDHPCVCCNISEDKKNCKSVCKAGIFC